MAKITALQVRLLFQAQRLPSERVGQLASKAIPRAQAVT